MSDENFTWYACTVFRKELNDRIEELEKVNKGVDWSATVAAQLKKKIEELEGWTENFKEDMAIKLLELEQHIDNHGVVDQKLGHDMMKNREEIAELREMQETIVESDPVYMSEQIDELKEYIDLQVKEIHTRSHNQAHKIEEVLRELITNLYLPNELRHELLEKLDSQGKTVKEPTPALDALLHGIDPAFLKTEKKEFWEKHFPYTEKFIKASGGEKVRSAAHTEIDYENVKKLSGMSARTKDLLDKELKSPEPKDFYLGEKGFVAIEPREDDKIRKKWNNCPSCYRCPDLKACEPRAGEHFILRDDGTPNNPILRALFFGGDEEYIIDWKFRYKRKYYEIVKREDLQWMLTELPYALTSEEEMDYMNKAEKLKEEYGIE